MSTEAMVFELVFSLQSYWHIGCGLSGGTYEDALALKNADGLPYIPGKSIKGLLKQAVQIADQNLWFHGEATFELSHVLFGREGKSGIENQGILQITNATLSSAEQHYFNIEDPSSKSHLYQVLYSTAIDENTGVAKEASLRGVEVVIPLVLTAQVALNTQHPFFISHSELFRKNFHHWLALVVSLVGYVGAKQHRGLGEVIVSVSSSRERSL